jgi:hypothetical protein
MRADLPLVDERLLDRVHELDRVLDRQNMIAARLVDQVDHGSQRRGLPGARWARDQHQPLAQPGELPHRARKIQLVRRRDLRGDHAEHRTGPPVLLEQVAPEPRQPRHLVGEVEIVRLLEPLPHLLRQDLVQKTLEIARGQRPIFHPLNGSVLPDHRSVPAAQMEVRPFILNQVLQE